MLQSRIIQVVGMTCIGSCLVGAALAQNSKASSTPPLPPTANVDNPNYLPFLAGPLDQKLMMAPLKKVGQKAKTYILAGTPATTQWGVFDKDHAPVLHINSGDTVMFETLAAADNQVVPGVSVKSIQTMNNAVPGRGPHTLTGPVYIKGAEPGDALRIHINKIILRPYGSNDSLPGKGLLPDKFPKGQVRYFYLDVNKKQTQFAPGIVIPLHPFPGVITVAQNKPGKMDSDPPGNYGGNMDLRILQEGSTLYLPVFVKGGLVWTGDSHAVQGNGEIDLTALETSYAGISLTIDVVKNRALNRPLAETDTHWVTVGYDTDLNKALDSLKDETVHFIMKERNVPKDQAEKVMYSTWNCPISEVVNGVEGVYCMIPKDKSVATPFVLPSADTATQYVTVAKNANVHQAMKDASWAMIQKISKLKKMKPIDTYVLMSLTLDCRIAPYHSGDKEVHCMLDKSLWTPAS